MCKPVPDDADAWSEYVLCGTEAVAIARSFKTKSGFMARVRSNSHLSSLAVRGMSWKRAFGVRSVQWRAYMCVRLLTRAHRDAEWRKRAVAMADTMTIAPLKVVPHLAEVLSKSASTVNALVGIKMEDEDGDWVRHVFAHCDEFRGTILERVEIARDTPLMCDLMSMKLEWAGHGYRVIGSMFHTMDAGPLVEAMTRNGIALSWYDAHRNHRQREELRAVDPAVRPIDDSFYRFMLGMRHRDASCNYHDEVMSTLDSMVRIHNDGRISSDDLDRARDGLFAAAARIYPVYGHLLNESRRSMGARFENAVVCLAARKSDV